MSILYDSIYFLPLFIIAFGLANTYLDFFQLTPVQMGIAGIAMIVVTAARQLQRKIRWMGIGVLLLFAAVVVLAQKAEQRIPFIQHFAWVGTAAVGITLVSGIGIAMTHWTVMRRGMTVILIGLLCVFLFQSTEVSKAVVISAFLLMVVETVEEVQTYWKKYENVDRRKHLVSVFPFLFLGCLLMAVTPVSKKPFDWKFILRAYEKVEKQVNRMSGYLAFGSDDFDSNLAGFSERGRSQENVNENDAPVIQVKLEKNAGEVLYLAGKAFQEFEQQEWKSYDYEMQHERTFDAIETIAAIRQFDEVNMYDYFARKNLEVTYQEFNTKCIFVPTKALIGNDKIFQIDYEEKGGNILAKKKLGYGSYYDMNYYVINKDHSVFSTFLNREQPISEKAWNETVSYCYLGGKDGYDYEAYKEYKNQIAALYGAEFSVSDEVKTCIEEMTKGATTKLEKLEAIETALRGFSYRTEDGKIPKTVKNQGDYLEYFLLEHKEGYCVHYATAFVLMARYLGMPARYVQGYYVPIDNQEMVTVTQSMAHAWPEVYFENVGWIAFEPTPGYRSSSYWQTAEEKAAGVVVSQDGDSQVAKGGYRITEQEKEEEEPELEETRLYAIPWNLLLILFGGILLLLLLGIGLYQLLRQKQFEKKSEEERIRILCQRNMRLLQKIGFPILEGETLEEYGDRLQEQTEGNELEFLDYYERSIYDKERFGAASAQYEKVTESYQELLLWLKQTNQLQYFLYLCGF